MLLFELDILTPFPTTRHSSTCSTSVQDICLDSFCLFVCGAFTSSVSIVLDCSYNRIYSMQLRSSIFQISYIFAGEYNPNSCRLNSNIANSKTYNSVILKITCSYPDAQFWKCISRSY